ncbi:unnamed protein product [Effrenium voratum]|uniref:EF-hand domain-containing protein n=1 Tax=Effrenium voratum TaxID=2562239 RepID=A0AA36NFF3_9DINO|nr:unnamed protein product [Effrenium voratum]
MAQPTLAELEESWRKGAKVEAQSLSYGDGEWYEVKVLQLDAKAEAPAKVHFVGFGDDEDEWLPLRHLRLQATSSSSSGEAKKDAAFPLSELLKAFCSTERLVQKVHKRTGLTVEELQQLQGLQPEKLQAEFKFFKVEMNSAISFDEFATYLARIHQRACGFSEAGGKSQEPDMLRLELERSSKLQSQVAMLEKQVASISERFNITAEQVQTKQAVEALQKQVAAVIERLDSELPKVAAMSQVDAALGQVETLQKQVATLSEKFDSSPKVESSSSPVLQQQVEALAEQLDAASEQVEHCKAQTEQAVGMVERLAETLQKQAMDSYNMEQAFIRSESKMIGLQASSVSVLEGRLRVFVKSELDGAVVESMEDCRVFPRLQALEEGLQKLSEVAEKECRWLREAVEALSESLGMELTSNPAKASPSASPNDASPSRPSMAHLASPEGRNAALFERLDADGDGDVSLQEFHKAQVLDSQLKAQIYDQLDTDLDGRVSREEFLAAQVSPVWPQSRPSEGRGSTPDRGSVSFPASSANVVEGEWPLITAILAEDSARATSLLRSKADIGGQDQEGCTALHRASALTGLAAVRSMLLEMGGAFMSSLRDLHMRTALHHAALAGCVEACQQLLDAPNFHDVDRRALHGRTALHLAAEYGHAEVCRALLDHKRFTVVDVSSPFSLAGVMAHLADVLTCYSARPELAELFHSPGDILDFQKASVLMAEKTIWELALGHILALIFIPSGFAGTFLLYRIFKPQYRWLRWPFVLLNFAFYVAGALMHCSFTFVGLLVSAPSRGHAVPAGLYADFKPFFEIICHLVGETAMLPGCIFSFVLLAAGMTELPRWTALLTTGPLQLLVAVVAPLMPLNIRMYMLVTTYNLSSGIWHLTMAASYWLRLRAKES